MHKLREFGVTAIEVDKLDEARLSIAEMRFIVCNL